MIDSNRANADMGKRHRHPQSTWHLRLIFPRRPAGTHCAQDLAVQHSPIEFLRPDKVHHSGGRGETSNYPISASISIGFACSGATPIAIVNATKPSIRPLDLRLLGLRLPASSRAITVWLTHIVSTG